MSAWISVIALLWLMCGLGNLLYIYYRWQVIDRGDVITAVALGTVGTLLIVGGFIHRQYKKL